MTQMKRILKLLAKTTVVVLLCLLLSPLRADDDQRSREEVGKSCAKLVKQIESEMQRWVSTGQSPRKFHQKMHADFFPLIKARKFGEAEKVAKLVLKTMKQGLPVYKPKDLKQYRRKTDETQYLILPLRPAGQLYGGQTAALQQAIEATATKLGAPDDHKKRNWGFHLIIPTWRFDPKHTTNKRADIARAVNAAFEMAIRNDVSLHITVESHEWNNRPDLWNYADKDQPGYDPKNSANVEWSNWDGTPHPHRYRNWGTAESMPPVICYNSPNVLREVSRMIGEVVAPPIKSGLARLKKEGKTHLFSGVTVGAEPALPNYENIDQLNPTIARLMDQDGSPKTRLGYNALTNNGYSKEKPPNDFAEALAQINRDYTTFWAQKLVEGGIPASKMYTHVAAGTGVIGSPQVDVTNAPLEIAFIDHARPGWTTYPVGPFQNDFSLFYEHLKRHGNPHWASTEAGPTMGPSAGKNPLSMKDYLERHFDYGATVVVFNTGATSKTLSDILTESVWGDSAIKAYQDFLTSESR